MVGEDAERSLEMLSVDDEEPVETFGSDRANEALRDRVCLRRSHWRPHDLDSFAAKDGVEVAGELAVAIPDQETHGCRSPV
jgi:hypothetical protein